MNIKQNTSLPRPNQNQKWLRENTRRDAREQTDSISDDDSTKSGMENDQNDLTELDTEGEGLEEEEGFE